MAIGNTSHQTARHTLAGNSSLGVEELAGSISIKTAICSLAGKNYHGLVALIGFISMKKTATCIKAPQPQTVVKSTEMEYGTAKERHPNNPKSHHLHHPLPPLHPPHHLPHHPHHHKAMDV